MSLPPPEPNPVDAALAAYIEQKIEKRLAAERGSLLAAEREFCNRLRELRLLTTRLEDAMTRLGTIMELNQRLTVIDLPQAGAAGRSDGESAPRHCATLHQMIH